MWPLSRLKISINRQGTWSSLRRFLIVNPKRTILAPGHCQIYDGDCECLLTLVAISLQFTYTRPILVIYVSNWNNEALISDGFIQVIRSYWRLRTSIAFHMFISIFNSSKCKCKIMEIWCYMIRNIEIAYIYVTSNSKNHSPVVLGCDLLYNEN